MSALDEALELKRAGQLDEAVIALEGVLAGSPGHPLALAHLAEVQVRRGRLQDASSALDRAESWGGTTAFTARLRGDIAYKRERWEEASQSYRDAEALGDRGTWALVQLARCRLHRRDTDGARGAASRAIERDPGSPTGWVILGDIAVKQGAFADAETMYGRAHERAPDDQWAYAKLVEVRLLQLSPERRDHEVSVLLKTVGKDNPHLLGVLARLRSRDGDNEAAARAWGERSRRTGDFYARKMQGFALRKAGRLDEAATILGACLVEKPDDLILFRTYVSLQRGRGAIEELRRTLEQALPDAASRRGAFFGELRKLPAPDVQS
ncbi:MAG: tetratricopeptide repeat protein [Actinomycetota bacterium]|nr:tetratricopeptide repeat protein [Actinomycetota bacterium]